MPEATSKVEDIDWDGSIAFPDWDGQEKLIKGRNWVSSLEFGVPLMLIKALR
jgi:hypothetical protein